MSRKANRKKNPAAENKTSSPASLLGAIRAGAAPGRILRLGVTLALLAVIFDLMTGFLRWSFDYVIPALCAFAMIVIGITSIIRRQHITDYIIYMVLSSVFGIVPLLFLLPGWTTVTWPTVLTAAAGIIYLAALLLFVGRDTWRELRRRLHL